MWSESSHTVSITNWVSGNSTFKGMIYAPNGGVRANGNPTILGSMASRSVSFGGAVSVLGWDGFFQKPPPSPTGFVVLGWQELSPTAR